MYKHSDWEEIMFCYQCEQTVQGAGCTRAGVCGKDNLTANMQDLLISRLKLIGDYAWRARREGRKDDRLDRFVIEGLFSTVTNA